MSWANSVLPIFTSDSSEKLRIAPDQVQIDTTHLRPQATAKSTLSRTHSPSTGQQCGTIDKQELPTNVYRLDRNGQATLVAGDINRPDGLAFSPDETKLYVIEDGVTPPVIRVYDVVDNGAKLANGRTFITAEEGGIPDGLRVDIDGNLWCGWGGGEGHD